MQYGNTPMERMLALRARGLNRTMQYGNKEARKEKAAAEGV